MSDEPKPAVSHEDPPPSHVKVPLKPVSKVPVVGGWLARWLGRKFAGG